MDRPIIEVNTLSKRYVIAHQQMYETFRDTVVELAKKPFRMFGNRTKVTKEEFWALRDVSFTVQPGQRLGIIGRNGAGKSTLLKVLSQITPPTSGSVTLRGRVASLLEVGTGFHAELTGRENIFLNGAILGMKQSEIRKKFDEIVAFAEIDQFLDTPVKRYSSGMYVRLAFAVAAHLDPEILIVDEVLAVGDTQFQKKCLGKMQDVAQSGRTILFVSHNLGAIKQLCDSAILLDKGCVAASGNTDEIVERYLTSQSQNIGHYEQPSNPKKKMNLRKVQLNPGRDMMMNTVNFDEDIVFRIEYEIHQRVPSGLVWIYLQGLDGIMPFASVDYDLHPELQQPREPGYYQTDLTIPKKWLNTGMYNLVVVLNANTPVVEYDRVEALRFEVIDNGTTPKSVFNETGRGGVLQPFLDWKTKRIGPNNT